jgi:hypothetical protein
MTLYNLSTAEHWKLFANSNVSYLKGWFGYFVTENSYDKLTMTQSNGTAYVYTGTKNSSQTSLITIPDDWSMGGGGGALDIAWYSDFSVANYTPPNIAQVAPRCRADQTSSPGIDYPVSNNYRVDGILIAQNDTIYFLTSQPANRAMLIRGEIILVQ